jgi:hypothetical protein
MNKIGQSDTDLFSEQFNLYNHDNFYISVGTNSERKNVIAIRWQNFPRNAWCLISEDIVIGFLQSLLTNTKVDKNRLEEIIDEKINGR